MYKGTLLANIWLTDDIVAINPDTGEVIEKYEKNVNLLLFLSACFIVYHYLQLSFLIFF